MVFLLTFISAMSFALMLKSPDGYAEIGMAIMSMFFLVCALVQTELESIRDRNKD